MKKDYAKYLLNKTSQDYNLIAKYFSNTREQPWQDLKFLFTDYLKKNEKILDLGCGNGRFYKIIKNQKCHYIGVDTSEELIKIAKKKYPKGNFQLANGLNLPFPSNYFDKIYCIAVLHHLPSKKLRLDFLKEAKRVLKPKGFLFLTIWNLWSNKKGKKLIFNFTLSKIFSKSKLDFKDIFYPWKNSQGKVLIQRYIHCFTKRELKKNVRQAGFQIKKSGETNRRLGKNIYLIAQKSKSKCKKNKLQIQNYKQFSI